MLGMSLFPSKYMSLSILISFMLLNEHECMPFTLLCAPEFSKLIFLHVHEN